jgi:hypothetical protein
MRINIEDRFYKSRGRTRLSHRMLSALGGDDTYLDDLVDGAWLRANLLAQPYWLDGPKKLIPPEEWSKLPAGRLLLEVGLAHEHPEGIYVEWTEEQYSDWFEKQEQRSEAGKKNASRPRDAQGRLLPKGHQPPATASDTPSVDGPQPSGDGERPSSTIAIHPSPSGSFSGSASSENEREKENARARAQASSGKPISGSAEGSTYQAPTPLLRPASPAAQTCTPDDIAEARREWLGTLEHYKAGRQNLLPEEELLIARSIQRWGKKPVLYAIWGKRVEPKDPKGGYDPGKNLALRRVLNHQEPDKFERLMNLGIQAHHREVKHGVSS